MWDKRRWLGVRSFVLRNRQPGAPEAWVRAEDYLAVADAFGLSWPTTFESVCDRLRWLGDDDPHRAAECIVPAVRFHTEQQDDCKTDIRPKR